MNISIIVAAAKNGVIGQQGKLPWHLSADLKHFKATTLHQVILMGRKTYESIGKPLPKRQNWVITRQENYPAPEGIALFGSLEDALKEAKNQALEQLFIIGGEQIYRQTLPYADTIYLTAVNSSPEGDAFFQLPDSTKWHKEILASHTADAQNEFNFEIIKLTKN